MNIDNYLENKLRELNLSVEAQQDEYFSIYNNVKNMRLRVLFSYLHGQYIQLFKLMNECLPTHNQTGYFWADPSRELIAVIELTIELQQKLAKTNYAFILDSYYETLIHNCRDFLKQYRGSTIPSYMKKIDLYYADPIFQIASDKSITNSYSEEIKDYLSSAYVNSQIQIMQENVDSNSYVAIGKAKELLESVLKSILNEQNESIAKDEKLTALNKKVCKILNLSAEENNSQIAGVKQVLGGLSSIVDGMSELRNEFGDGHGQDKNFTPLPTRYSKLAVGATTTYVLFLLETYEYFKSRGGKQ